MLSAVLLGFVSVAQAGMNRRIGDRTGVVLATLMSNSVLLAASLVLFFAYRIWARPANSAPISMNSLPLWYFAPGILGLLLVAGIPYVISQIGALRVFAPLIVSQIVASIVWDRMLEGKEISALRITGALITCVGAVLCQN